MPAADRLGWRDRGRTRGVGEGAARGGARRRGGRTSWPAAAGSPDELAGGGGMGMGVLDR